MKLLGLMAVALLTTGMVRYLRYRAWQQSQYNPETWIRNQGRKAGWTEK